MKKLNIIIFIICIVLIFLNIISFYDLTTFEKRSHGHGGILAFIAIMTFNVAISGILFLILFIRSIKKKERPNIYTLLNVVLLILLSLIAYLIVYII